MSYRSDTACNEKVPFGLPSVSEEPPVTTPSLQTVGVPPGRAPEEIVDEAKTENPSEEFQVLGEEFELRVNC